MEDRSEWTSHGRQIGSPAPSFFLSLTVLSWGLCLPSSLAFDPNDLFMAIPLQAVVWSSYCFSFPVCCSCCQLGNRSGRKMLPAPHEQNLCWEGRWGGCCLHSSCRRWGPLRLRLIQACQPLSYALMDNSRGATRANPAPPPSEATMPLGQVERQKSISADCGMTQDAFTTHGQEPWDFGGHLQLNCSIRSRATNFTEGLGSTLSTLLHSLGSGGTLASELISRLVQSWVGRLVIEKQS